MMKSQMFGLACLAAFSAVACTTEAQDRGPSSVLRDLGVTRFDFSEADKRLVVMAYDQNETVVASLELTTGRFYMEDDNRGEVDGRQLAIRAFGKTIDHESAGYAALNLPFPREAKIGAFLIEPMVEARLARWGVHIDPATIPERLDFGPALAGETAYFHLYGGNACGSGQWVGYHSSRPYGSTCYASTYGGCSGRSYAMKKFPRSGSEWGEYRCCEDLLVFAERACTVPNSTSSCGATGPNGCAVCWSTPIAFPDGYENAPCEVESRNGYCEAYYCVE